MLFSNNSTSKSKIMKLNGTLKALALTGFAFAAFQSNAQVFNTDIQYMRPVGKEGLNVYETSKETNVKYEGLKVRVGGDFALQFQGLDNSNEYGTLVELSPNFTLPTANLNLDVQLYDGVRMHLRTYLSSRHHTEAYVKGGYIQIDKLDFIQEGFLSGLMDITTIKIGMNDINYGDAHFRRSDNASTMYNPFVGNYLMDAFTTEPYAELTFQKSNFLLVAGATNGRLNQSPTPGDDGFVAYGKLGYDNQVSEDIRWRLTGSIYNSTNQGTRDYLYGGDRAGGRYYHVMDDTAGNGTDFEPRFNPGFAYQTAFQVNPFVKWKGLEFFGIYEMTMGRQGSATTDGQYTQLAGELLYRIGQAEKFYLGGRYNTVFGEAFEDAGETTINRFNVGGGWFMTNNIMAKIEYVYQNYDGDPYIGSRFENGEFSGVMFEAAISF